MVATSTMSGAAVRAAAILAVTGPIPARAPASGASSSGARRNQVAQQSTTMPTAALSSSAAVPVVNRSIPGSFSAPAVAYRTPQAADDDGESPDVEEVPAPPKPPALVIDLCDD